MARFISECASFDRVTYLLRYDPEGGLFYWLIPPRRGVSVGSLAGSLNKSNGYIQITIDHKKYQAHRIAHLLMTGHWPEGNPEHANRIRHDNRWENIKDLARNQSENAGNQGLRGDNHSGFKGVSWSRGDRKWQTHIMVRGWSIFLGLFHDLHLAGLTYDAAAKLVWGSRFSCLNFPTGESDFIVLSERAVRKIEEAKAI